MAASLLIWMIISDMVPIAQNPWMIMLPVWAAGLVGGVLSTVFSPVQGPAMAVTAGVIMALSFLGFRFLFLQTPLQEANALTLWPVWFPPAFYLGAYAYIQILRR